MGGFAEACSLFISVSDGCLLRIFTNLLLHFPMACLSPQCWKALYVMTMLRMRKTSATASERPSRVIPIEELDPALAWILQTWKVQLLMPATHAINAVIARFSTLFACSHPPASPKALIFRGGRQLTGIQNKELSQVKNLVCGPHLAGNAMTIL